MPAPEALTGTPRIKVESGLPGINVRVIQSYKAGKDTWRGKIAIAYQDDDLIELEGSVKQGREGDWFAPASREYENAQGQTKYVNTYWFNSKNLAATCKEAVMAFVGNDAPIDDDDLPI